MQQQMGVPTWEYRVISAAVTEHQLVQDMLNLLGEEGYQVVAVLQEKSAIVLGRVSGVRQLGAGLARV